MSTKLNLSLFLFFCLCLLGSCVQDREDVLLSQFTVSEFLSAGNMCTINEDSLALVEGMICDDENLIVYDFHSGSCYTLFDKDSGRYITRFGTIGQGPAEIPSPCLGYLSEKCFSVFSDQSRMIMQYNIDSLRSHSSSSSASCLVKYNIPDAQLSRIIPINDGLFIGAGTYKSRYQYVLFDKHNKALSYGVDIYNSSDETFNVYTKFLSNQGVLVMHPNKKLFAYSLNFSSNMDFFQVKNEKIQLIKSLRLGNPDYYSAVEGNMFSADLTEESIIGYIDVSATSDGVYALYSDGKAYESGRRSNVVLAFDWEGNPVKKYILDTDVYYITVDEEHKKIFAAVKDASNYGWSIKVYPF